MSDLTSDELMNATVAAGAIWALLELSRQRFVRLTAVRMTSQPNQVDVEFDFLACPYRITVECLDEPKQSQDIPRSST